MSIATHGRAIGTDHYSVRIGPEEVVLPPGSPVDSPFFTLQAGAVLHGYVAAQNTRRLFGANLGDMRLDPSHVLRKGVKNSIDGCGAWLESALKDGDTIRGWYHAEEPTPTCDKTGWITRKTIAYAESDDGGLTFSKIGYPNNLVLSSPPEFLKHARKDDEGDLKVIRRDNYYYMYFRTTHGENGWRIHLARAPVSSGGKPGTWKKYFRGSFSEPGIEGRSSSLTKNPSDLASSYVVYNHYLNRYMGLGLQWKGAIRSAWTLSFSDDGINWKAENDILLPTSNEFSKRHQSSSEFVGYPSIISIQGNPDSVGQSFWLYYMYINPGMSRREGRELARRRITLTKISNKTLNPAATIAFTVPTPFRGTRLPPSSFSGSPNRKPAVLGYLYTSSAENSDEMWQCEEQSGRLAYIVIGESRCADGDAGRRLGWLPRHPIKGSVPLEACGQGNRFTLPPCPDPKETRTAGFLIAE